MQTRCLQPNRWVFLWAQYMRRNQGRVNAPTTAPPRLSEVSAAYWSIHTSVPRGHRAAVPVGVQYSDFGFLKLNSLILTRTEYQISILWLPHVAGVSFPVNRVFQQSVTTGYRGHGRKNILKKTDRTIQSQTKLKFIGSIVPINK